MKRLNPLTHMFGLDPFSRPVAIAEILLLLLLAAFVGWLLGRLGQSGRIRSLRASIATKQAELVDCRHRKNQPVSPATTQASPSVAETLPTFVHADPLLPVVAPDVTPELIDADVPPPLATTLPQETIMPVSLAASVQTVPMTGNSEASVLSRIAARANEINFDRIGRAAASEADDLKDIVGVGPFLERKLHSLGIYTFRQIANFTKEDINKVNEIIEFFPGRIERDNWVQQSKEFHLRKYTDKE